MEISGGAGLKIKRSIAVAACFAAAVVLGLVLYFIADQHGQFLPSWINWQEGCVSEEGYTLTVEQRHARISDGEKNCLFESSKGQKVQDAFIADIDNDGRTEAVVLLWKKGRYGEHLPFWVELNDTAWGQHIFIYRYDPEKNRFAMVWGTSYIPFEVERWDYNKDGRFIRIYERGGATSDWSWLSWGLTEV